MDVVGTDRIGQLTLEEVELTSALYSSYRFGLIQFFNHYEHTTEGRINISVVLRLAQKEFNALHARTNRRFNLQPDDVQQLLYSWINSDKSLEGYTLT